MYFWCSDLSICPMFARMRVLLLYFLALRILTSSFHHFAGCILQTRLICRQCTVLIDASLYVLLTYVQPPILTSTGDSDTHHILIGTFLPSASAISDIQYSDNSYSGACMPFLCLTTSTSCT